MARDLIDMLRTKQWLKNLFVAAPLFFAGQMLDPVRLPAVLMAAGAFCLLSSAVYVFNDICDQERDRAHPLKQNRALAAGRVGVGPAAGLGTVLAAAGLGLGWWAAPNALVFMLIYLGLNAAYSLYLKRLAVIDALCVAAGFLLRVLAGGAAGSVEVSHWLVLMTVTLSLLMVLGKRRHELVGLGDNGEQARESLAGYSLRFLNHTIAGLTFISLVFYVMYTLDSHTTAMFHTPWVLATAAWVLYGMLRYLDLIYTHNQGGDPARLVLSDPGLLLTCLGWIGHWAAIIYLI